MTSNNSDGRAAATKTTTILLPTCLSAHPIQIYHFWSNDLLYLNVHWVRTELGKNI